MRIITKIEYLNKLKRELRPITLTEREKSLAYFSEVIDDRMEDGISEEAAIEELGSISAAAERIVTEARAQGQLKPRHSVWEIVLVVLGVPLWFPLLFAVAIVVFTMYGVVWILIGCLFITSVSLTLGGVAAVFSMFLAGSLTSALACLGIGLACAGLGVALFIPSLFFANNYFKATPIMWEKLKFRKLKDGVEINE